MLEIAQRAGTRVGWQRKRIAPCVRSQPCPNRTTPHDFHSSLSCHSAGARPGNAASRRRAGRVAGRTVYCCSCSGSSGARRCRHQCHAAGCNQCGIARQHAPGAAHQPAGYRAADTRQQRIQGGGETTGRAVPVGRSVWHVRVVHTGHLAWLRSKPPGSYARRHSARQHELRRDQWLAHHARHHFGKPRFGGDCARRRRTWHSVQHQSRRHDAVLLGRSADHPGCAVGTDDGQRRNAAYLRAR